MGITKIICYMYNKKMTLRENIIYGGTCYLLAAIGVAAMVALYEFIESLFNLPV